MIIGLKFYPICIFINTYKKNHYIDNTLFNLFKIYYVILYCEYQMRYYTHYQSIKKRDTELERITKEE